MTGPQYDAFISYRRSDGAGVARWLRREIQSYRLPRALRGKYNRKLRVYLDTAYERGTSDFYEQSIRPALLSSRYLLVVATPDARLRKAGAEDWMAREVADFSNGPHGRNVVAVRGAGEFDDPLPADLAERFPNIEIVDLRGAGRFSAINPARAARLAGEKLKLIAPLLDLPHEEMPRLRQEEEKLQQARLGAAAGATLGVLTAVSALSVFALNSRNEATKALHDSMFAVGSMVLQSKEMETGTERSRRLQSTLIGQGCDLIDKLASESGREAQIGEVVTCHHERASVHEALKEYEAARRELADAVAETSERFARTSQPGAGRLLLTARGVLAEFFVRTASKNEAVGEFERLLKDVKSQQTLDDKREELVRSEAQALGRLGDLAVERGDQASGSKFYEAAGVAAARMLDLQFDSKNARDIAWKAGLHRLAGSAHMHSGNTADAAVQFHLALGVEALLPAGKSDPELDLELARVQAAFIDLETKRGDAVAAEVARAGAYSRLERATSSDKVTDRLKDQALELLGQIEKQASAN